MIQCHAHGINNKNLLLICDNFTLNRDEMSSKAKRGFFED